MVNSTFNKSESVFINVSLYILAIAFSTFSFASVDAVEENLKKVKN